MIPAGLALWLGLLTVVTFAMPHNMMMLVALTAACALVILAFLFPGASLILAIFTIPLSVENFYFFLIFNQNYPTFLASTSFHKIITLGLMVPAILRYGIKPKPNPVILALLLTFSMTFVFADRLPGLDNAQVVQTLVGLTMPYIIFNMRLQPHWIESHLRIIASLPFVSIGLGYAAEFAGLLAVNGLPWTAWGQEVGTGAYRLRGINIAAGLAVYGYIGFVISLFQAVLYKKKGYYIIAGLMVVITLLTGTRGSLAAEIAFAGLGILIASNRDLRGSAKMNFAIIGGIIISLAFIAYWPNLEARFTSSYESGQINTSGREMIWEINYDAWQQNPIFGRGLGAGAIVLVESEWESLRSARATHNEYLRLLVDGGIVGLSAFIIAMIALIVNECRGIAETAKRMTFAFFVSFALYSFTDNTISSPTTVTTFFVVALLLYQARLAAGVEPLPQTQRLRGYA